MFLHWFHIDLKKWIKNGIPEALSLDRQYHQNSEDFLIANFLYQFSGTVQHGERRCTAGLEDYLKNVVQFKNRRIDLLYLNFLMGTSKKCYNYLYLSYAVVAVELKSLYPDLEYGKELYNCPHMDTFAFQT
jgi:hypothetical protein